jgi:hypothetical protein
MRSIPGGAFSFVSCWSKMVDADRLGAATGEIPFDQGAYDRTAPIIVMRPACSGA